MLMLCIEAIAMTTVPKLGCPKNPAEKSRYFQAMKACAALTPKLPPMLS